MARPRSVTGGRPIVIASRFSEAEAKDIDARRGSLSRAEYLRWLTIKARKEDK